MYLPFNIKQVTFIVIWFILVFAIPVFFMAEVI